MTSSPNPVTDVTLTVSSDVMLPSDVILTTDVILPSDVTLEDHAYRAKYTLPHIIVSSIVVVIIMLVIIFGNVLVIIAVARDRSLSGPQNWFIASLAMSDILVGLFIMPLSLANELMGYWVFGTVLCELWLATDVLLCTASILNLVIISLDRYWSITKAMTYIRRRTARLATLLIAIVWILSMVICFPPLVGWKRPQPEGKDGYAQCELSAEPGYVVYSTVGSFYIPLCVMVLVYLKIFLVTRQRARRNLFPEPRPVCVTQPVAAVVVESLDAIKENSAEVELNEDEKDCKKENVLLESELDKTRSTSEPNPKHCELHSSHEFEEQLPFIDFDDESDDGELERTERSGDECKQEKVLSCYVVDSCTNSPRCCQQQNSDPLYCLDLQSLRLDEYKSRQSQFKVAPSASVDALTVRHTDSRPPCSSLDLPRSRLSNLGHVTSRASDIASMNIIAPPKGSSQHLPTCLNIGITSYQDESVVHKEDKAVESFIPVEVYDPVCQQPGSDVDVVEERDGFLGSDSASKTLSRFESVTSGCESSADDTRRLISVSSSLGESSTPTPLIAESRSRFFESKQYREESPRTEKSSGVREAERLLETPAVETQHRCNEKEDEDEEDSEEENEAFSSKGRSTMTKLRTAQYLASTNLAIMAQTIMRYRYAGGRFTEDEKVKALQDPQHVKRKLARARERRAFLVLGVVMATFIGCWLPFFSVYLVTSLAGIKVPPLAFAVIFWLGYCNSALNPFIYTIFNRDFRRAFHKILCSGRKSLPHF